MKLNSKIFIGKKIKLTNKYKRISITDDTKSFLTEDIQDKINNIQDMDYGIYFIDITITIFI
jgi:hypothetical protein